MKKESIRLNRKFYLNKSIIVKKKVSFLEKTALKLNRGSCFIKRENLIIIKEKVLFP